MILRGGFMAYQIKPAERQLNLLGALLKNRDGLVWEDVARVDGYNDDLPEKSRRKRFERDLHELRDAGLVIDREPESISRIRYTLNRAACLMPPINLTPEQRLLVFRLGMAYLQDRGAGPLTRHLSTALLKLQAGSGREGLPAVIPPAFIRRSLNRRPAEAELLDQIGNALIERRRVKFPYEARQSEAATRTVAPYCLVSRRGGWYLLGLDLDRQSVRTFRLSRIRGKVSLATPDETAPEYQIPTSFDPEQSFSTGAFGAGENAFEDVAIHFDPDVAFIVQNDFGGTYPLQQHADGSVTMHLAQAYPGEVLRYACEFPGHWRVEGPPALRTYVMQRLQATLDSTKGRA